MSFKVTKMTKEKRNIIASLLKEYDVQTAENIQDALKDLLGRTIQDMLESKMIDHLGYESYCHSTNENSRNGKK